MLRLAACLVVSCVVFGGAAEAAAQAPVPARSCAGTVCVEAVERGDTVLLRARNTGAEAREVSVLLVVVNGYENPLGDRRTVTVAPGGEATALTLVPAPPRGGRPRGYRYLFDSEAPLATACIRGACLRTTRTQEALTLSVHNALAVPIVVAVGIGDAAPDTVEIAGGSARTVFSTWARATTPRRRLRLLRLATPPDTLRLYEAPVAGRVLSDGLPADVARAYASDTSASAARALAQNRHAYRFDTPEAAPVVAARAGVVVEVEDSVAGVIDIPEVMEQIVSSRSSATEPPPAAGYSVVVQRVSAPINHVLVRHDDGTLAWYLGLERGSAAVAVGDAVEAGAAVGRVAQDRGFSFSVTRMDTGVTLPLVMRVAGGPGQWLVEGDRVGR